ncbi:SDR family oxidoreductase [Janibacter sp. CX7]|uniref:SDR family oxidoreductase n=1 Tax=Janibacter sp. CX7 TaxID=2963431 RepID=UPI0020CDC6B9|nr:SDR family oxidoreductase [Janibacter sp. CX7]UTT65573.1 SDR family oxidoreductase [Janibacter sp. CX7]
MDLGITGRTALVLGAGSGLGEAIAHALAQEGVTVVAAGRTLAKVEATAADITAAGGRAHALAWDLAELDVVDERVRAAEELAGGSIDILVNNTGGPPPGGVLGHEQQVWETHFRSMVLSVIAITDRVVPGMRERGWGRVVTSTSSGVVAPIPGLGLSNALRSALVGWSKTLAGQVARDGVTANVVVPGRITTERTAFLDASRAEREGRPVEEVAAESRATIPAGRYGEPHEYGQTVAFLASVPAAYVTGSVVRVDGGLVAAI